MVNFKAIEKKWQNKWEKAKIFHVKESKAKKKYYVLEMYPYPSASYLHMGHVRNYTIGDVYARFKRMQGFNVLYPIGYDSFGLPAEMAAKEEGIHPKKYAENAIKKIMEYQKALGNSYDWSRVIASHDPDYYKWNQIFFLKMFEKGLAYRKKAPVNWCENCESVLANEEAEAGKCWRCGNEVIKKDLEQWFYRITKYSDRLLKDLDKIDWPERIKIMQRNWIGKSYGVEINFEINGEKWPIFTTRPDTIYGVTFMVIAAQHPKLLGLTDEKYMEKIKEFVKKCQKAKTQEEIESLEKEGVFTGSYAINPFTNEKVPVYAGNFVLADYGCGMVMGVPAHDQRDFEFATKYDIPIKFVIKPYISKSVVLGPSVESGFKEELKKNSIEFEVGLSSNNREHIRVTLKENQVDKYIEIVKKFLKDKWWVEIIGNRNMFIFKNKIIENFFGKEKEIFEECKKLEPLVRGFKNIWEMFDHNSFYHGFVCYTEPGVLVSSGKFSGLKSTGAIEKITDYLEKQKLGKRSVQYKIRDWLISRQRYWGTPIPIIYCSKCGIVVVPEKDLPVLLPEKVDFKAKTNPLLSNKNFVSVKCPKCKSAAKRETDTMGGFVDSSWYFLRYCDNKNKKKPFDNKKIKYWMPVDQYIGGAEHAVMHLMYARFFIKVLKDLGFVKFDEPFTRLFNQGVLYKDGAKMSKSEGNVVFQTEISDKYGIDTARLFLMFVASPDKQMEWSDEGVEGSFRIINKLIRLKNKVTTKTNKRQDYKINVTIQKVTENIDNFQYPKAIIAIIEAIDYFSESVSKKNYETLLKLISPFCPHIAEELWNKLGRKSFISLEKWPVVDKSKIDKKIEVQEKKVEELSEDINNIIGIMKNKGREVGKAFVYVLPKEKEIYSEDLELIKKKTNLDVKIYAVNDKKKYDPENKAKKAKPGKPAIYLE